MKKPALTFLLACLAHSNLVGISLKEIELRLAEVDPLAQKENFDFARSIIELKQEDTRYLPSMTAIFSPVYGLQKSTLFSETWDSTFGMDNQITQLLPTGTLLSATVRETASLNWDRIHPFSYQPNFSFSLNQPLALWDQNFGLSSFAAWGNYSRQKFDGINLERTKKSRDRLADFLQNFTKKVLLEKHVLADTERLKILDQMSDSDEVMFEQGKLSYLDLRERELKKSQQVQTFLASNRDYLENEKGLYYWSNQDLASKVDVELNLDSWEAEVADAYPEFPFSIQARLGEISLGRSLTSIWSQEMNSLPNLQVALTLNPAQGSGTSYNLYEAFWDYWDREKTWDWSLGINLMVPMFPWDMVYQAAEKGKLLRQALEPERQLTSESGNKTLLVHKKLIDLLAYASTMARKQWELEKKRLEQVTSFYSLGRISEQEVRLQQLQVQQAYRELLYARVSVIAEKIRTP